MIWACTSHLIITVAPIVHLGDFYNGWPTRPTSLMAWYYTATSLMMTWQLVYSHWPDGWPNRHYTALDTMAWYKYIVTGLMNDLTIWWAWHYTATGLMGGLVVIFILMIHLNIMTLILFSSLWLGSLTPAWYCRATVLTSREGVDGHSWFLLIFIFVSRCGAGVEGWACVYVLF